MSDDTEDIFAKLAAETARITWPELERFFAKGMLISVDDALDLVAVGVCFAEDNAETIKNWMGNGQVYKTETEEAIRWQQGDPDLWALVIPPWILVQETSRQNPAKK